MSIIGTGTLAASGSGSAVSLGTKKEYFLSASGTFGGGTLTLEFRETGTTTWITVSSVTGLTAANLVRFTAPMNSEVRVTLTGATTPSVAWYISE